MPILPKNPPSCKKFTDRPTQSLQSDERTDPPTYKRFTGVGKHFEMFNKNKRNCAKPRKKALLANKKALLFNEKALLFKKFILKNCTNYLKRIKNKNALNGWAFCLKAQKNSPTGLFSQFIVGTLIIPHHAQSMLQYTYH